MLKGDSKTSSNQTQEFEGLSIDILEEMRKNLGFNYRIYLAPDGKFGVKDRLTGKWNGVVKEIIEKVYYFTCRLFVFPFITSIFKLLVNFAI